ncbi:MAG: SH3 beta-barrel fold-containing protein [Bacteroidales bacterium]
MKTTFRTKVFRQAYELMTTTGKTFAVCLSKAWALYRLSKRLHKGIVSFCYEKADGTLRKAKGTLKEVQHLIKGTASTENVKTIRYFDVEANGFRSFKIDNLITINSTTI